MVQCAGGFGSSAAARRFARFSANAVLPAALPAADDLEQYLEKLREKWNSALEALQRKLTKSTVLRKSNAPVSLLQFYVFALQCTVDAYLSVDNTTRKMVKAGMGFLMGAVNSLMTSDPRAVIQGSIKLARETYNAMMRRCAAYYTQELSYYALRPLQADFQTSEVIMSWTVPFPSRFPIQAACR